MLDKEYDAFVRSRPLDEAGKEKLRKLTEEASMLTLQFSQNLLKENKAFILHLTDKAQLSGLPDTAIDAAAQAAKERNLDGWVITLDYPSYSPFLIYSDHRDLRKRLHGTQHGVHTRQRQQQHRHLQAAYQHPSGHGTAPGL